MEPLANSVIGIGAGVYLGFVVYNGNLQAFWTTLSGETGYLEFMVALFIISSLAAWGPTSTFTDMAIVLALIGLSFRVATNSPAVVNAAEQFGNGQIGLFGAIGMALGLNNAGASLKKL